MDLLSGLGFRQQRAQAARIRAELDVQGAELLHVGGVQGGLAAASRVKVQLGWAASASQVLGKEPKIRQSRILIGQNVQSNENQNAEFPDKLCSAISIQEFDFTTNAARKLTEGHNFVLSYVAQTRLYWEG